MNLNIAINISVCMTPAMEHFFRGLKGEDKRIQSALRHDVSKNKEIVFLVFNEQSKLVNSSRDISALQFKRRDADIKKGSTILGLAGIKKASGVLSLFIAVLPGFRNKGIGSRLLKKITRIGREKYPYICAAVWKKNQAAIHLYKKHGFCVCSDGGDNYLMMIAFNLRGRLSLCLIKLLAYIPYRCYRRMTRRRRVTNLNNQSETGEIKI